MMTNVVHFIQSKPNVTVAFAAVGAFVLTFLSILLTGITVFLQRKHNRQSVRPIGNIVVADYENCLCVRIRNQGLGPLIIDSLEVWKKGCVLGQDIVSCMPDLPEDYFWDTFASNLPNTVLSPGEENTLIELSGKTSDSEFCNIRDKIRQALVPLALKLRYRDIYGKRMRVYQRNLKWFARRLGPDMQEDSNKPVRS